MKSTCLAVLVAAAAGSLDAEDCGTPLRPCNMGQPGIDFDDEADISTYGGEAIQSSWGDFTNWQADAPAIGSQVTAHDANTHTNFHAAFHVGGAAADKDTDSDPDIYQDADAEHPNLKGTMAPTHTAATQYPTTSPTKAPTFNTNPHCTYHSVSYRPGSHFQGHGDQWCNLCKCGSFTDRSDQPNFPNSFLEGYGATNPVTCTQKVCAELQYTDACTYVTCTRDLNVSPYVQVHVAQPDSMLAWSEHAQLNHNCAYDNGDDTCKCTCA